MELVGERRPMLALIDPMMPELSEPLSLGALSLRTGFKVRRLCEALEVSDRQLHRLFSDSLWINPKDWLRRERLVQARRMLLEGRQDAEVNRRLD